ncbi:MAG: threonine synthase [Saprospiraceae bacterium]|nr:threonine synthase [Saprospiraceae bacterium]
MKLYSTNNPENIVYLKEAVLQSLPEDKGLYMPVEIAELEQEFYANIENFTFKEIAFNVASALIGSYIPSIDLKGIIDRAINFSAPVVMHDDSIGTLELFHGPSLAFKDFGARFMAELISYFIQGENRKVTILVATSGDTGGAVAAGFYDTPGVEVVILYPKGKVSPLQEKQLTTLGKNIYALEIEGTFDDCQAIVKQAFLDNELNEKYNLSSANSINIARLIPQSFYYFEAYKQVVKYNKQVVFAVPSGNFGNLTAGLLAKKMGLPIHHFIAATNINKIVPDYLRTGKYEPKPSVATISNAMDVGAPSNFVRLLALYDNDYNALTKDVSGFFLTDEMDKNTMKQVFDDHGYTADPHGAIGYAAVKDFQQRHPDTVGVYLETAHPAKFLDVMEVVFDNPIDVPDRLQILSNRTKVADLLPAKFENVKHWLLSRETMSS